MTAERRATWMVCLLAAACEPSVGMPMTDGGARPDRGTRSACEVPLALCDGECVDVRSSGQHCGGCGRPCDTGYVCQSGACRAGCDPGLTACAASCVDLQTDTAHCGSCGAPCGPEQLCVRGRCACPDGFAACDGACVDPNTDLENCGLCGRACGSGERCNAGSCVCSGAERETDCGDGEDDDCDGAVDCADLDCVSRTRPCMGACGMGVETCRMDRTWSACVGGDRSTEICGDGIDQDCDGTDLRSPDAFEPNDHCGACPHPTTTLDPDVRVSARFDSVADTVDCYAFDVQDDFSVFSLETITLTLTGIPAGHDYDVYLYRSQADCLADRPLASGVRASNADEMVTWTESRGGEDSGTYLVVVRAYRGYSCTEGYELRFVGLR